MRALHIRSACAVTAVVMGLVVVPLQAQQAASSGRQAEGTKSPVTAGILEAVVPTAGFAYAGDWSRGLLPNAIRLGGAFVFGINVYAEIVDDDDYCKTACVVGGIVALVGSVWAVTGAVGTANDRNDRARSRSADLVLAPSPAGGLSLGVRLAW